MRQSDREALERSVSLPLSPMRTHLDTGTHQRLDRSQEGSAACDVREIQSGQAKSWRDIFPRRSLSDLSSGITSDKLVFINVAMQPPPAWAEPVVRVIAETLLSYDRPDIEEPNPAAEFDDYAYRWSVNDNDTPWAHSYPHDPFAPKMTIRLGLAESAIPVNGGTHYDTVDRVIFAVYEQWLGEMGVRLEDDDDDAEDANEVDAGLKDGVKGPASASEMDVDMDVGPRQGSGSHRAPVIPASARPRTRILDTLASSIDVVTAILMGRLDHVWCDWTNKEVAEVEEQLWVRWEDARQRQDALSIESMCMDFSLSDWLAAADSLLYCHTLPARLDVAELGADMGKPLRQSTQPVYRLGRPPSAERIADVAAFMSHPGYLSRGTAIDAEALGLGGPCIARFDDPIGKLRERQFLFAGLTHPSVSATSGRMPQGWKCQPFALSAVYQLHGPCPVVRYIVSYENRPKLLRLIYETYPHLRPAHQPPSSRSPTAARTRVRAHSSLAAHSALSSATSNQDPTHKSRDDPSLGSAPTPGSRDATLGGGRPMSDPCTQILQHGDVVLPTRLLRAHGIPYTRIVQRAGDVLITRPGDAVASLPLGLVLQETVMAVHPDWKRHVGAEQGLFTRANEQREARTRAEEQAEREREQRWAERNRKFEARMKSELDANGNGNANGHWNGGAKVGGATGSGANLHDYTPAGRHPEIKPNADLGGGPIFEPMSDDRPTTKAGERTRGAPHFEDGLVEEGAVCGGTKVLISPDVPCRHTELYAEDWIRIAQMLSTLGVKIDRTYLHLQRYQDQSCDCFERHGPKPEPEPQVKVERMDP